MALLRLSKLMAMQGLCSRREADEYISQGLVLVDGQVVDQLGSKVDETQSISLLEKAIINQNQKLTVLLNKPVGYVSGTPEKDYKPAASLIIAKNCSHRPPSISYKQQSLHSLAPAGRLDIDSEGLLVLTQDGRIARTLINPDSIIEKEYLVRFQGSLDQHKLDKLRHGLSLDGRVLKPAKVIILNKDQLKLILIEGRKRQIRRMCELVDLQILKLQRVRIGAVKLGKLPLGQWRTLKTGESF